ncbi:MAG TPA: PQQ-dependent sugar dehydrogenase, partial [Polyangiaceae bacterium]
MKRLRILGTGGGRTSARTLFVPSMTWAIIALAQPAHAELGPMFSSTITVDPEYATGVDGVTDIAFAADGRAVITRKSGQVVIRRTNGTLATLSNLFPGIDTSPEKGLLGVVADPNVATNNTFYFYVSNGSDQNDKHRVVKGVLTAQDTITIDPMPVIAASRNNGPGLAGPANHNGGGLVIHKGQLYVGVGDTGANATPPVNKFGSCLNKPNGKILRVNLDGSVPDDNPLVGKSSVTACEKTTGSFTTGAPDTRIFAWGFRNPWRIWVDPMTDLLWVGDVGEQTSEEISVGKGGQHYGFPFVEGSMTYKDVGGLNCTTMTPAMPCTPPAYAYPWNEGGGKGSVTGGLIPSGCGWEKAMGGTRYLFGDYVKNWIHSITVNAARDGVTGTPVPFDTHKSSAGPVSFRMGPDEALYIAYYEADSVYRYTPTDRTGCSMGGSGGAGGGGAGGSGG